MLLLTAFIWGTAFVAQRTGLDSLGPISFLAMRSILGVLVLLPVVIFQFRSGRAKLAFPSVKAAFLCGAAYTGGALLQQAGLQYTTAGKAGFISSLYIVLVPMFSLVLKKKPHPIVWFSAALSFFGMYLISSVGSFSIGLGEAMMAASACCYSFQIMLVDHYVNRYEGVSLSAVQFGVASLLMLPAAFIFENPTLAGIRGAGFELLYTGVFSSGIAFTLQILGQKRTPAAIATLIMCLESVFSALAGALILGEVLTIREISGCAMMLIAALIAQLTALRHPTR